MKQPLITLAAISNVFCRLMHFQNEGDVEHGHCHTYDHLTLLSKGRVLYETLNNLGEVTHQKEFVAPGFILVKKDLQHRITALESDTVCTCIHALRTIDEEIIAPDFLIEPLFSSNRGEVKNLIREKFGKDWKPLVYSSEALQNSV